MRRVSAGNRESLLKHKEAGPLEDEAPRSLAKGEDLDKSSFFAGKAARRHKNIREKLTGQESSAGEDYGLHNEPTD